MAMAAASSSPLVLLVDDDLQVRELCRRVLTRRRFEVLPAASAEDALHVLREEPRRIALLLSDVEMPGLSGVELAKSLRRTHEGLPVLFITGSVNVDPTLAPPTLVLRKPFRVSGLMTAVEALLGCS